MVTFLSLPLSTFRLARSIVDLFNSPLLVAAVATGFLPWDQVGEAGREAECIFNAGNADVTVSRIYPIETTLNVAGCILFVCYFNFE